jgi:hypothetical protein
MEGSPDAQQPQGSPVRPSTAAARAGGSKDDDAVAVRVAVHIRPLVENELAKGCQEILDVTPNTPQVVISGFMCLIAASAVCFSATKAI